MPQNNIESPLASDHLDMSHLQHHDKQVKICTSTASYSKENQYIHEIELHIDPKYMKFI